jgi:hypothetical protein
MVIQESTELFFFYLVVNIYLIMSEKNERRIFFTIKFFILNLGFHNIASDQYK